MKAIILAGGYAKRLWPITENMPKQLLPVAGRPIIEYPIENIERTKSVSEIIISINAKFECNFREWFSKHQFRKKAQLVIEKTYSEKEKLGSLGALNALLKKFAVDEDVLVIGGDNLFEFSLVSLINYWRKKKASVVALYDIKDKNLVKGRYGIAEIDKDNKIIGLEEKPRSPKTSLVNTACCILTKQDVKLLPTYIEEGNNKDAFGYFIRWLVQKKEVFGYQFNTPWFDIGSFEAYNQANEYYTPKRLGHLQEKKTVVMLE